MKKILTGLFGILVLLVFAGCGIKQSTASKEQALTEANQSVLIKSQPPVKLKWSLERDQINKRTELWNSQNKVSYIYLIDYGKVMGFYTIKGKVSSVNSQVTNPTQYVRINGMSDRYKFESPAEDGSYGTNGDAIFFFTTEGVYVEWNGTYMLADRPLKMSTPPALVYTKDIK